MYEKLIALKYSLIDRKLGLGLRNVGANSSLACLLDGIEQVIELDGIEQVIEQVTSAITGRCV